MKNYQDRFGNEGYGAYGKGNFVQTLPQLQRVSFGDFSGGLNTKDSREDTQPNSSPDSLDIEVTLRDRLRPVPGTTTEEMLARTARQLVLHASLDYTSELVMFDAPFIGIKTGDVTVWTDVGLPPASRVFAYVNFGGTLLFSNGRVGMYAKEAGKSEVTLVEGAPAAHTFASFAGRVFAGASIIGGNREPLGISWSGASSDHEDWETFDETGAQTGAGFELLIDDMAQGNYIVTLRTMGLDFLAIFLRNSIWIGRRTNQRARPADFQPRVSGVGAVNEASCVVTRFGVVHLHDSGVYLFDGNNSTLISEQINSELLPLDKSQLTLYSSSYNPVSKQIYLFTPTCTWVYDLERQRWHKRSLIANGASIFAAQIAAVTWVELTGTWGARDEMWEDFKAQETGLPSYLFLSADGDELAREDEESSANFGIPLEPYWDTHQPFGSPRNWLVMTKQLVYKYEGEGSLRFDLVNGEGLFEAVREVNLRRGTGAITGVAFLEYSGLRAGVRLRILSGKPEILAIEQVLLPRGPRIERPTQMVIELNDTGLVVSGLFTDFSDSPAGALPVGWALAWSTVGADVRLFDVVGVGRVLRFIRSATSGQETAALWTAAGTAANMEVLAKIRVVGISSVTDFGLATRSENNTLERAYTSRLRRFPGSSSQLDRRLAVSSAVTIASEVFAASAGVWYWLRLRSNGSNHSAKYWQDGATEPLVWNLTGVNADSLIANYAGIYAAIVSASDIVEVAAVGLDTNGGTAPGISPATGWILQAGKFNFRIIGIPTGYSVRAGGTTTPETSGAVNFALLVVPPLIELLDTTDTVVATYSTPVEANKEYLLDLFYE